MTLALRHYPPAADNVRDGIDAVLAGAYDVPGLNFPQPPRILDIGAHVGDFSVWARSRWPEAELDCYEPHPESARYCRNNVAGLGAVVHECAVVGASATREYVLLHEGAENTGQRSVYVLGEQRQQGLSVRAVAATELPPADILKADTEGCEVEILRGYLHILGLTCIMVEWHRPEDYITLRDWLPALGFALVRDDAAGQRIGNRNMIFVRRMAT